MSRSLRKHTELIRSAVSGWLTRNNPDSFTVPILLRDLKGALAVAFDDLDLNKAMSNELKRREALGLLECIGIEVVGLGRPPKVYRQKWRM